MASFALSKGLDHANEAPHPPGERAYGPLLLYDLLTGDKTDAIRRSGGRAREFRRLRAIYRQSLTALLVLSLRPEDPPKEGCNRQWHCYCPIYPHTWRDRQ